MTKNKQNVFKSAALVTVMMLAFKVFGFIKQAVVAYYFGATAETDIYYIAYGFISGISEAIVKALSVSLVAVYTSLRVAKGKEESSKLISGLLEILFPIFLLLAIFIFGTAPLFSKLLAPSYTSDQAANLVSYIRILAPVLLFGVLELCFGAVLDSNKSFFVPRLQSFIYSALIIISCITISSSLGIDALVIGQYASSIIFTILLIIAVKKYIRFSTVKFNDIPELKNILMTAIPLFIGNSALQINQIVDKSITSGLGAGAASALSYCHTLEQFVTNIMIVNIGNVMFANFAEFVAKKNYEQVKRTLKSAINVLICLLMGISIVTIVCSKDIVSIVYYRGSFSYDAVVLTSLALVGYAFSFVAVAVRDLSVKSLYAFKDTKHPMIASITSIVVNIAFSITLSRFLGIFGVSLATSISAVVGMVINAYFFKMHLPDYDYKEHVKLFVKIVPAGVLMAVVAYFLHKYLPFGNLTMFVLITIISFSVFIFVLTVCRIEEVEIIKEIIKRKITRKMNE